MSRVVWVIFKREFMGYFRTPVAYVFMVIFLLLANGLPFFIGKIYERDQANLEPFFIYLPWLFLVVVPAVAMRQWAEERRSGTIELLLTLPVTLYEAVLGKFFAGWAFLALTILLTTPLALTVNYLGDPDNGVIVAGYCGAILMAGSYLGVSSVASAMSKNQVIGFILSLLACFVLVLIGWGVIVDVLVDVLPSWLLHAISSIGFITHYSAVTRGVLDSRDVVYFLAMMMGSLFATASVLDNRRI